MPIPARAIVPGSGTAATRKPVASVREAEEAERRRNTETTALVTSAAISALPILFRSGLMKKVGIPVGSALAAVYLLTRNTGRPD